MGGVAYQLLIGLFAGLFGLLKKVMILKNNKPTRKEHGELISYIYIQEQVHVIVLEMKTQHTLKTVTIETSSKQLVIIS